MYSGRNLGATARKLGNLYAKYSSKEIDLYLLWETIEGFLAIIWLVIYFRMATLAAVGKIDKSRLDIEKIVGNLSN